MRKIGILFNQEGAITNILEQDDLNFENYDNGIDITDLENKEDICKNPSNYSVVNNEVVAR